MPDRSVKDSITSIRPRLLIAAGISVAMLVLLSIQSAQGAVQPSSRSPFDKWPTSGGSRQAKGAASTASRTLTPRTGASQEATSYRDLVLADQPVGYWELNELLGTVAYDATGSHDGIYGGLPDLGLPGLVTYPGNLAPYMDGTNDRVTANSMSSGIDWSRGFTLEI